MTTSLLTVRHPISSSVIRGNIQSVINTKNRMGRCVETHYLGILYFFVTLLSLASAECEKDEFSCGGGICLHVDKVCDGVSDCINSVDEENCFLDLDQVDCTPPTWFKCSTGRCIPSLFVCDKENDCLDRSDERNCAVANSTKVTELDCKDEFMCLDQKYCISLPWVCDGNPDCDDASDETAGCSMNCTDGFQCKNKHCIIQEFHCDGDNDCGDNSDEEQCDGIIHSPNHCLKQDGLFLCHDGIACLELRHVCDNFHHCFDRSDEIGCNVTSSCLNSNCSHRCHITPGGPWCSCPPGYRLDTDLKTCIDIDECSIFGSCGQKCQNSLGSFQCSCDSGYRMTENRRSCEAIGGEALLLFASAREIRGMYLKSQLYFPVARELLQVSAVSHNGRHVYWTNINLGGESIFRSNEDGSDRIVIVDTGLGLPEDLEVDYVTGNIYFTDSEKKHIGVCTEDGIHCTVLVNEDVDKPRALALLPQKGTMFWSDWGKVPMIATSGMDGSQPKRLVDKDIDWPNGLAIDFSNDRIYWVDAKAHSIGTVRLDGSDRQVILKNTVPHPYGIAVFEDSLFWSDWEGHEIEKCNKFTGKNHTALFKEHDDLIYGVHIYHPLLHPRVPNPCNDARCEGICLLAPNNSYTCACSEDAKLALNQHSCLSSPKKYEVALMSGNTVVLIARPTLGKQELPALELDDVETVSAIAYNSLSDSLLISDSTKRKIFQLNLESHSLKTMISSGLGYVVSMSHDPYTNNLYVCDDEKRTIDVWSLHTKTHQAVIKYASGHRPLSVVVAPDQRLIYVAVVWPNDDVHISQMSINGTERNNLLVSTGIIGSPVHLNFDPVTNMVYWVNPFFQTVEEVHADGTRRNASHILSGVAAGLAVVNSTKFWTLKNDPHLYYGHEHFGERQISLGKKWGQSYTLTSVATPSTHTHPCQLSSNGGCSHICLASANSHTCICPTGLRLSHDNKTCLKNEQCTDQQFKCSKDFQCISRILRCDGRRDCNSGEDEEDCEFDHCASDQFRCTNGQCISQAKKCDFRFDCADRSDEVQCVNKCKEGTFPCGSGECLSELWVCDSEKDCLDGSDENVCGEVTCDASKFTCKSGTCIPKSWECDGDMDCMDGSDEYEECRNKKCRDTEWKCKNKQCIDKKLRCDGYLDCGDHSDENECPSETKIIECEPDQFLCSPLSICVPLSARCNHTAECPRGEDETECASCSRNEFQCKNKRCVSNRWLCDGEDDCGDKSDEDISICDGRTSSGAQRKLPCDEFRCSSGECIPIHSVCNGVKSCEDGSDEGGRCETSCSQSLCQGICVPTPTDAICQCNEGYTLNSDGHSCSDVDECAEDRCSQTCINTPGSFTCNCLADYILKNDRITCKASGAQMTYVIGGDDEVKKIPLDLNHVELVMYEPGNSIFGIDVDSRKGVLYWSSGTTNTLNILHLENGSRSFISGVGRPGKISLDWVTGNIFYIDRSSPNQVTVCHMVDRKCSTVLTIEEGAIISEMIFDPISGYIFYSKAILPGLHRPHSKIFRYDLDMQNATLLASMDITWVSGMVVDHIRKELFWADLHQQVIERIGFDGKERKIVFRSEVHRPHGLGLFENSLFWLSKGSGELTKCDIFGDHKSFCKQIPLHLYDAKLLVLHHEARQPQVPNPCSNVSCDPYGMCVITPSGGRCFCEDGTLAGPQSACSISNMVDSTFARARTSDSGDRVFVGTRYSGTSIFLAILLTVLAMVAILAGYIFLSKNRSMPLALESIHFRNPTFGVTHMEGDMHHRLLSPGQHEYVNQTAFVKHPNGDVNYITPEPTDTSHRVIPFQDCNSEDSDHYQEVDCNIKMSLIP